MDSCGLLQSFMPGSFGPQRARSGREHAKFKFPRSAQATQPKQSHTPELPAMYFVRTESALSK